MNIEDLDSVIALRDQVKNINHMIKDILEYQAFDVCGIYLDAGDPAIEPIREIMLNRLKERLSKSEKNLNDLL